MRHDYIRFDWAIKRLLRQKANFGILEGLLTVLLEEQVHITEILESESNQDAADDKFNRVDIKAKNNKGEIIIVEIQNTRELAYMERILYGVSKAITEHIHLGQSYEEIKKVYSVSVLYFDIGGGTDYLYHGQTSFIGVHTGERLEVTTKQRNAIVPKAAEDIFPEYYLIRVNEFNKVAVTPLEEWISYLKTGDIPNDATAPGLAEAREKMRYYDMSPEEQHDYFEHLNAIMIQNDVVEGYRIEIDMATQKAEEAKQKAEEEKQKAEEAKLKEKKATRKAEEAKQKEKEATQKAEEEKRKAEEAKQKAEEATRKAEEAEQRADSYVARMKAQGLSIEAIMDITGLSRDEIETL
ncbi:MAG: PD-(D/E)XK nuclease family transposase [Mediterranea sp.]|jgi:predicted transposase/invertase (TIGR01784 family)|nr:PD-(D/E)XK nuclease family transposase [Mediterranea sp.]